MSILIRGMDMPTGNNAVSIIIFPNGKVSLAHDHRFAEYAEAIPIPPHGRLGDLDALEEQLKKPITMDADRAERLWDGWHECTVAVDNAISNMPTIIEAEGEK